METLLTLPTSSEKHQRRYNEMSEKSGADFDKEYCDLMVKDHKDVVDMFKKAKDTLRTRLKSLGGVTQARASFDDGRTDERKCMK
jgi:predicted outer membrane protein